LNVVIEQRRIEERAKNDPARGASHDGDEDIGEDAIEIEPSADRASNVVRIKTPTDDYSASALSFLLFQAETQVSGIAGIILKKKNLPYSARSDPIHDRRTGGRGDEKPAAEIDVSASALSSSARRR
jgi:hypothetical protein